MGIQFYQQLINNRKQSSILITVSLVMFVNSKKREIIKSDHLYKQELSNATVTVEK